MIPLLMTNETKSDGPESTHLGTLTLHQFRDFRNTNRYQNALTWLERHKKDIEKSMIDINEILKSLSEVETNSQSLYDSAISTRNDVFQWYIIKKSRCYTSNDIEMHYHRKSFELVSTFKYFQHLNQWLRNVTQKNGSVSSVSLPIYLYTTLNPIHSYMRIFNVRVHTAKMKPIRRYFTTKQRFGKLAVTEAVNEIVSPNGNAKCHEKINFIIPLYGRYDVFIKFIKMFENVALVRKENVSLYVLFFLDGTNDIQHKNMVDVINYLGKEYPATDVHILTANGSFQRGIALQEASSIFPKDALLFYLDIDFEIDRSLFNRIRLNTYQGKQIYSPIVFSKFDPQFTKFPNVAQTGSHSQYADNAGFWRVFGYGMLAIYKSDLDLVGGFNTSIKGWGKEDVDFIERVLEKELNDLQIN